jgi:hypothetical protein
MDIVLSFCHVVCMGVGVPFFPSGLDGPTKRDGAEFFIYFLFNL